MWQLILIGLAAAGAYRYSLWRRPHRKCPRGCKGGDNVDTTMFRGSFGRCWFCHGSGKRVRLGVRLLMPGTARDIRAGRHGRNY